MKNKEKNKNYIINMIVLSINDIEKNKYKFLSIIKRVFNYVCKDIIKEIS